jgi:DNA-binding response OmpR family regulator
MKITLPRTKRRPKRATILVVEDEAVLRNLLAITLRGEGFTVLEAEDGDTGQKRALKYRPALVLLDIIMPGMNGIDMLKLLRQDVWGKTAKVILLTNLGDNESIEKAKAFGVTDYLVKSDWSLDEIAERIKEKLSYR